MADYTHFTPEKRREFLATLEAGGTVTKAAQAVGINRRTAYAARDADQDFAADWDEALESGTDVLEDEVTRRAIEGGISYKFDRAGKPLKHPETDKPYFERTYSDTLLIFMLKARRPEKYRERAQIDHSGKVENLPEAIEAAIAKVYGDTAKK